MYSALSTGSMSIVAPTIGSIAAAVAVAWDIATGGTIESIHWVGILMSIAAVILLAFQRDGKPIDRIPMVKAVGAGVSFAAFFIAMSHTHEASALWPLVAARSVTIPLAFLFALRAGVAALPGGLSSGWSYSRVSLTWGQISRSSSPVQRGPLGVTAVLSSLYPAFTVMAAFLVLRERPTGQQRVGIAIALVAVLLLSL